MRSLRPGFLLVAVFLSAVALRAQSTVPTVVAPIPAQELSPGGSAVTIDVRNHISVPGVIGTQFAQFNTVFGRFNVELRSDAAPRHVANFLTYVNAGDYTNTFLHRSAPLETANGPISIVQGGGFRVPLPYTEVPRRSAVPLEYNLTNARGTLAAARTSDPNSATAEWYFNVRDNSTILGPQPGSPGSPGYTVFGRVLGTGMTVIDAMAALPLVNASGTSSPDALFGRLPVRDYSGGDVLERNLVVISSIRQATLFPTGGGPSVVELSVENSAPSIVSHLLSGSTLTLTPVSSGSAAITVRATDTNGNVATASFTATVAAARPVFTGQPIAQTAAAGGTVVFNAPAIGAASYVWKHNDVEIPGATTGTLVIEKASAADAGRYSVTATNSIGAVQSDTATLDVATVAATEFGRLINLSLLTLAGSGDKVLTMGAVIGPISSPRTLPLVIRAVGPTLAQPPFEVSGVLADPVMRFYSQANTATPIGENDDWGGSTTLINAFTSVGAFALPAGSRDSAIFAPAVAAGGYSVQVTGKNNASGNVIAEIYDASGTARTAESPRLINLSTLAQIDAGADLAVGFALRGATSRTVLIRGVGPSLSLFNVEGRMADPRLELFDANRQRIGANDDWSGNLAVANAAVAVGAFGLTGGSSRDAALLVSLPPGNYSARVSGTGSTGGMAIIEVYEVP